jgi:hypothetical protein
MMLLRLWFAGEARRSRRLRSLLLALSSAPRAGGASTATLRCFRAALVPQYLSQNVCTPSCLSPGRTGFQDSNLAPSGRTKCGNKARALTRVNTETLVACCLMKCVCVSPDHSLHATHPPVTC